MNHKRAAANNVEDTLNKKRWFIMNWAGKIIHQRVGPWNEHLATTSLISAWWDG